MDASPSARDPVEVLPSGRHDALPTRSVIWGVGCRTGLNEELGCLGASRGALLTTASLAREAKRVAELRVLLGDRHVGTIDYLPAHVPAAALEIAQQTVQQSRADVLIAFGGGSVIDAAKALAAGVGKRGGKIPPIVVLPTTLSGAEFAHVYGVLEETNQGPFKGSHADPAVAPRIIFLDPELTESTPESLWLSSGIKALDHAIEGLLQPGERPITDTIALAGIARMVNCLPRSRSLGLGARLEAHLAAWMCYFAPATIRAGLSHHIGYILGGSFRVPHSLTSCVTLAPVMRTFVELEPQKLARIALALSISNSGPEAASVVIDRLIFNLGLPRRLRDLGLDADATPRIARLVRQHFPEDCARFDVIGTQVFDGLIHSLW